MTITAKYKLFLILITGSCLTAQTLFIDRFEDNTIWHPVASEDVEIALSTESTSDGQTLLRLDYHFKSGAGYGGIARKIDLQYPENYRFRMGIRGEGANNNFEFKLIDDTGENVWWKIVRNMQPPAEHQEFIARKREIQFAWGPAQDHDLYQSAEIQIIISSMEGGSGTLWFDNLYLESYQSIALDEIQARIKINDKVVDDHGFFDNKYTYKDARNLFCKETVEIDLTGLVELGGMKISWNRDCIGGHYRLQFSKNGNEWFEGLGDDIENLGITWTRFGFLETRFVRIEVIKKQRSRKRSIQEIEFIDPIVSSDMNHWLKKRIGESDFGNYPRYMYSQASYWTIFGNFDDDQEALINTDGQVETGNREFLLEPVIVLGDEIINWADVTIMQTLENGYLPVPNVIWEHPQFILKESGLVYGKPGESQLLIQYVFTPKAINSEKCCLLIIGRPFQVNPDYQSLGKAGGFSPIYFLEYKDNILCINEMRQIHIKPGFRDVELFNHLQGLGLDELLNSEKNRCNRVCDSLGLASFAIEYKLMANHPDTIVIRVPLYNNDQHYADYIMPGAFKMAMQEMDSVWTKKLNSVSFDLPSSANKYLNVYRSNLAYILINRDGYGIQPGSRSYERSWIRDGTLTSIALMRSGLTEEPGQFIKWYSSYQFESGKIPCVVDYRGPDPVPENDSHGQYILAVAEYYRFTHDTEFLKMQYPHVQKAVKYIDQQRQSRRTDYFRSGNDSLACLYGLMPESISHEGYMDKPRHSYWDDFFTLKGLKDAVEIANILEDNENLVTYRKMLDEFRIDLYISIDCTRQRYNIDYIPGCAELGDFDATSTTIGLWPVGEWKQMLRHGGAETFERYYIFFKNRRDMDNWKDYTPYEIRAVGAFNYMG
ncbi:MAG: hypothetical protein JXR87_00450, partial [Candidatus Marinimicrobia bacterium]|nr:hypothetical protein [Candidatus Neomarinimicrobiota bacterium]